MSLNKAKIVYYALIAVLVILLTTIGSLLDLVAAGLLAIVAPLLFRVICQASADCVLTDVERRRAILREKSADTPEGSGSAGTPFATLQ